MIIGKVDHSLIQISSILLCMLPFALLTGPFFPDLFISLISLIFLYICFKNRDFSYFKNNFFYVFILFYIICLLSSYLSSNPDIAFRSSTVYLRFGIFSLACFFILEKNNKALKLFTIIFLISFLYAISDGFYQYFFETSILVNIENIPSRLHLPFNDEALMGNYIARLFPLLLATLLITFEPNRTFLIGIMTLLIIVDVLVFISGERTALGLMTIATLMIIFFISKFRIIRIMTLLISICIMSLIAIYDPDVKERNIERTMQEIGLDNNSENIYLFSEIHEGHFISAWKIFKNNPVIGSGPNSFRRICNESEYYVNNYSCSTHPHNTFIQILAEVGLMGFMYLVFIITFIFREFFLHTKSIILNRKRYLSDEKVCILITISLSIFPFLPTLNFFNNWINIIYYLPVGFYLYISNLKKYDKS